MPRIAAETIEEHVRRQTERILIAARELFRDRGYRRTDMNDIASRIGLARNSLYRYYENKDHILLACIQRDMEPYLAQIEALETEVPDPRARLEAWVDLQLDIGTGPCHETMVLIGEIRESSPKFQRDIRVLHELPARTLRNALAEILVDGRRDPDLLAGMINSMVQSAAVHALDASKRPAVAAELKTAIRQIVDGDGPARREPGQPSNR